MGNSGQGSDAAVWERTPLAGETEAAVNKASLGMVPITCVVVLVEREGLGRGRKLRPGRTWSPPGANWESGKQQEGVWSPGKCLDSSRT